MAGSPRGLTLPTCRRRRRCWKDWCKVEEIALIRLTLEEIRQRYGERTPRRQFLLSRLQTVIQLLSATGHLRHLYLFGSFTTEKPTPNDLDCLAVMTAGFTTADLCSPLLEVFQHDICRLY